MPDFFRRFCLLLLIFLCFFSISHASKAGQVWTIPTDEHFPSHYLTEITLMNKGKLEGYIIETHYDYLVLACISCVQQGSAYPEFTIPAVQIKKIKQRVKQGTEISIEDSEEDFCCGCLNCWDPWEMSPEGCVTIEMSHKACLIASIVGIIGVAAISIAYEYNSWDRYRINGEKEKYRTIY